MSAELGQVRVVLINATHPGNIGAAARAMKNMGLSRLYLVEPLDFPSDTARWRAANAADLLDQAVVVNSLDEAIADCALVIGTSARDRKIPWPMLTPKSCASKVVVEMVHHPVALLFGREARGLRNEELQRCNYHVHIPTSEEYTSLNLAMAVQVIAYEIRQAYLAESGARSEDWDQEFATSQDVEYLIDHLERTLVDLDFHDPDNPRQLMTRLRRLFNRVRLDKMEVSILRGILTAVGRKIGL